MKKRKIITSMLSVILTAALLMPIFGLKVTAAGPTLTTTLNDSAVVRNDRLTFDVWARNQAGKKIASTVTLNGERVAPAWDDSDKTSYTLVFSEEGENTVVVSASSDGGKKKQLTYRITYKPAEKGEIIGHAVFSVEVFTLGCGYLIEPVSVPLRAGETAAAVLLRLLHENGFVGYYGGSADSGFYLAYIADGTALGETYNGYKKSGTAADPKKMELDPSIPEYLQPYLKSDMDFYDPDDYLKNGEGYLGEFVISSGSGWMYCVNNNFPNVGLSDMYLSDGDVVRVQFTLGYGADIGGMSALGGQIPSADDRPQSGYYPVADKDGLTCLIAEALSSGTMTKNNVKNAYEDALSAAEALNSSQSTVDGAVKALKDALNDPDSGSDSTESTDSSDGTEKPVNTESSGVTDKADGPVGTGGSENPAGTDSSTDADAEFSVMPEETDTSENTANGTQELERETVTSGGEASENTAGSEQSTDRKGKIRPIAAAVTVIAVLAAFFAVLFGIRLHTGKASFQNTNDDEGEQNKP